MHDYSDIKLNFICFLDNIKIILFYSNKGLNSTDTHIFPLTVTPFSESSWSVWISFFVRPLKSKLEQVRISGKAVTHFAVINTFCVTAT